MLNSEKVKEILDDHEKRIKDLEKIFSSKKTRKITTKKSIPQLLEELKEEKFFDSGKTRKEIVDKLAENGHIYDGNSLNRALLQVVKSRILGRVNKDDQWRYVKR